MSLLILLQAAAQMAWGYFGAAVGAGLATIGAGLGMPPHSSKVLPSSQWLSACWSSSSKYPTSSERMLARLAPTSLSPTSFLS